MLRFLVPIMMVSALGAAGEFTMPFSPTTFSAEEGCHWAPMAADGLRMNEAFIAAPAPGQDRGAWLAALKAYRDAVREGRGAQIVLRYDGVRAWVRLAETIADDFQLLPREALQVRVEARSVSGNHTLCVAFDLHDRAGRKVDWTGVRGTLDVPQDGKWHTLEARIETPDFDAARSWLRPIFGMDATHDATPGEMEIRAISLRVENPQRMEAMAREIAAHPGGVNRSLYDRPDLQWAQSIYTCHFTFLYDRAFYDPARGYGVDAFLDDAEREFGGYDAVVLWQGYPRLGIDDRNQFDFYRDLPGGLAGLRAVVDQLHARKVRAFVDYNPWDTGTRRSEKSDEEELAALVAAIDADGIFLDTMVAAPPRLRTLIDNAKPGVVFAPEGHPSVEQLGVCNASWGQWLNDSAPPGLLHLKWIEPRHMQHQIRRWDTRHREEIETAFFNGSGMLVWENVFGSYNPWNAGDRALWKHASGLLRRYAAYFSNDDWSPFYPTMRPGLYMHKWTHDGVALCTLRNTGASLADAPLFKLPMAPHAGKEAATAPPLLNLWDGTPLRAVAVAEDGNWIIHGAIDRLGMIAIQKDGGEISRATSSKASPIDRTPSPEPRLFAPKGTPKKFAAPPPGMVQVPAGTAHMKLSHQRREPGCVPDPGTPSSRWHEFLTGQPFDGTLAHDYTVQLPAFYIDETPVTNAKFRRFLDESRYVPKCPGSFLKHWERDGSELRVPKDLDEHPVVYVDLDDARAYAAWAGKRLPTEPEWHRAAQGDDGRAWPWGNEFDAAHCNPGGATNVVRAFPNGRSPFGCYDMAGNVWQWTESQYDDGHTRFALLRGGSFYKATGSIWYTPGGPQPNIAHTKFILMHPGLDRCATIGFRCAADAE